MGFEAETKYYNELIDARDRIRELEQRLAELQWREITEQDLPKVGDEVGCFVEEGTVIYEVAAHHTLFSARKWRYERAMTHFRPISAPARADEAKG